MKTVCEGMQGRGGFFEGPVTQMPSDELALVVANGGLWATDV